MNSRCQRRHQFGRSMEKANGKSFARAYEQSGLIPEANFVGRVQYVWHHSSQENRSPFSSIADRGTPPKSLFPFQGSQDGFNDLNHKLYSFVVLIMFVHAKRTWTHCI